MSIEIDPTKNFTPRQNPPKSVLQSQSPDAPDVDLSALDDMTREELIALVRRVCGANGLLKAALMTEDEAYDAVCLKLLADGLSQKDIWKALPALKEWTDRRKGRAKQQVELTGKDGEPLSVRLLAVQERLLKDVAPKTIDHY